MIFSEFSLRNMEVGCSKVMKEGFSRKGAKVAKTQREKTPNPVCEMPFFASLPPLRLCVNPQSLKVFKQRFYPSPGGVQPVGASAQILSGLTGSA